MSRRESNKEAFLHWFAGFFDGEGCLLIGRRKTKSGYQYQCSARINLRDDDSSVLSEIVQTLGIGTLHHHIDDRKGHNPLIIWNVAKIDDLVRLVKILDSHPLRSKKSADYAIWREAVLEISQGSRKRGRRNRAVYDQRRLEHLRRKLMAVKAYDAPETEECEVVKVKDVDNEYSMTIRKPPPNK